MGKVFDSIRAWACMYLPVQPPEEPREHLTVEELLEKFAASDEDEWEAE